MILDSSLIYIKITSFVQRVTLREKCPYSEFLWSGFSAFGLNAYLSVLRISPYSVRMGENTDQNTFHAV